ncbi:MAG: hypothetical protein WDA22_17485 [Bacteroidota bacterium]
MNYSQIVFFLVVCVCSYGQIKDKTCNCPNSTSLPDTTFYFSNGKAIGLCGYKEVDNGSKKVSFYEYHLFVCGQDSTIASGGWFLQNSRLRKVKDTLFLEDCPSLPIGDNFKPEEVPWTIEKMYFIKGYIRVEEEINRGIRKYNEREIQTVIKEYENIKPSDSNLDDNTMVLVDKLFIATISGSKKARAYFIDIPKKFAGLDAFGGEYYHDLVSKLSEWGEK